MTTVVSRTMDSTKVLLCWSKPIAEHTKWSVTMLFAQILGMIQYVCRNIKSTDKFVLIVPGNALKNLINDPVYDFDQVQVIYAVYDNDDDLKRDENHIQDRKGKLRFCHERYLDRLIAKLKVDNAIDRSRLIDRGTVNGVASLSEQRIAAKRSIPTGSHSSEPKRSAFTFKHGFLVKNIEQINSRYSCPSCKFVFRDPHQLECGHRICEACVKTENDQTTCLTCFRVSSNKNIWHDRGFGNEMQHLPISCSVCDWTGSLQLYQKHIDQKHPDGENNTTIIDVYTQQTDRSNLSESVYTTETRQQTMSDILSPSHFISMPNNSNVSNDQYQILLTHFQEILCVLSNHVNMVSNDQQRINNEIRRSQTSLQTMDQNFFSLKISFEDTISRARGLEINQDLSAQQIWSLKQAVHDSLSTSHNGTYLWKITGVGAKIADAQSERHRSIYSSPFYSSPTGYKMCLRLYLNGDNNTRGKYVSLFLVIMKGDFDAILEWPFAYKVLFRLIDQSTPDDNQHGISDFFWPGIRSDCFQRPVYTMNHACGIKEFLSVEQFEQNQDRFIKDDSMFIEAKIDFTSKTSSISSTGESPNDEEHVDTINEDFMHMS